MVWWAYQQVGVDLDDDRFLHWQWEVVEQSWVTPDELVDHEDLLPEYLLPPPEGLIHALFSPAHLMLTDALGRRTGRTADGPVLEEIPGALWRDNGESESITSMGADPTAVLAISGYDTGRYTLLSRRADGSEPPQLAAGFTRPGQVEQVAVGETAALAERPVAADDELRVEGRDSEADVLANDHNTAGAGLTVSDPPSQGTAAVTTDRKLRYIPAAGASGTDRLTYRLCRGGACSDAFLTVTLARDGTGAPTPVPNTGTGATAIPNAPLPQRSATLSTPSRQAARKAVRMRVRCSDACRLTVTARVRIGDRVAYSLGPVRHSLRAGKKTSLRLRLSSRQRAAVRRGLHARRSVAVRIVVNVRHADDSTQWLRQTVFLR
jgi:hypothetical protein